MPRLQRLRWMDWLGLIGLAMLLVWTPAYVAQDPTERTLTGGESFTLPMPRDGDRAVLDLVVTQGDGSVQRFPGVMEIRIDTDPIPNGDIVGIETAYRISVVHHEVNASWPGGQLVGPATTRSEWFDAAGFRVWSATNVAPHAQDAESGHHVGGSTWFCTRITHLNDYAGQTVHYEPTTLSAIWQELRGGIKDGLHKNGCNREGGGGYLRVVNRAYETDTGLLFGRHLIRSDRIHNQVTQDRDAPHSLCRIEAGDAVFPRYYGNKYFGSHQHFSLGTEKRITFTEATESRCDYRDHFERWDWISPRFPYPVGQHARHHDADGNLLVQVDLVPGLIERGEGPPLPLAKRPGFGPHLLDPADARAAPTQTLGSIQQDDTPLIHGLALSELDRRARADAPESMSDFLSAGAALVAWGGRSDEVNATAENDANRWHLTYAQADGARRTMTILLQRTPTSTSDDLPPLDRPALFPPTSSARPVDPWTHQVYDACGDEQVPTAGFPIHCDQADPAPTDPKRAITDLGWLVPRLDAYGASAYGSLRAPEHPNSAMIVFDPWATQDLHTSEGVQRHPQPTLEWEVRHHGTEEEPLDFWVGGLHDMGTGTAERLGHVYRDRSGSAGPAITPASAVTEPQGALVALDPLETTVAVSGVALVVAAALGRMLAAAKSGAAVAFFAGLYAKIRKEDVLLHERRDAIAEALRAEPGLTAKELAARLDAGWGATVHHLETLLRAGVVARIAVGRNRHHFLAKEIAPAERRLAALRRDPAYAAFLDAVAHDPGRSLDEIATTLPRSLSGLSRTGSRLAKEGVVHKRREGRTVRFYPAAS